VVAVDLAGFPTECTPLLGDRLHVQHDCAIRLNAIAVDERDEVIELEMARGHRRFPCGAFLHLTIGELAEDSRGRSLHALAQRHADRLAQAVAK
jgi:hypothetical protein